MNNISETAEVLLVHNGEVILKAESIVASITKEAPVQLNSADMNDEEMKTRYSWF